MGEVQGIFEGFLEPEPLPRSVTCAAAEIALVAPILETYTYEVPAELLALVVPGVRVRVPLGNRLVTGFVVLRREYEGPRLKAIAACLELRPALTPATLALGLWVARHYGTGPGEALEAAVPAAVRRIKGGRTEKVVELVDARAAEALLVAQRDEKAFRSRAKVLRTLLEEDPRSDAPRSAMRLGDLLRIADVTDSPVLTLEKAGIVKIRRAPPVHDPFANLRAEKSLGKPLTEHQALALEDLLPRLESRRHHATLLHGVTGSGKTEVYLRLLERTLELGRSAILLVPEIALTPQTVERILSRVPDVAVLHSNLSDGDRARHWNRLRSGAVRVAVGPRSAIFAPLHDVGLIVLDEEHETTFKQQSSPRYHARDLALYRGRSEGALVVFGTATPSLECEGLVQRGEISRHVLPHRVEGRPMPQVAIVDMRHQKPMAPGGIFSAPLVAAMDQALAAREQVLLFLNRRGFSTTVLCRACGWKASCRQCAIQLTHYRQSDRLLCHYCAHEEPPPRHCPECRFPDLRYGGFGTEKVAEAAAMIFPGKRIARMDGETLRARGAAERIFMAVRNREVDILVGTQVLAKGLDLPGITLVGVVSADTALLIPDFRSAERTFQLLCQVAGRTGRGENPGRVLVQTYTPEHYAIRAAARHDTAAFAAEELRHRQALGYPPAGHLLRAIIQGTEPEKTAAEAQRFGDLARALPAVATGAVTVLGPAPCPIPVIKGLHRHHLLFRTADSEVLTSLLPLLPRKSTAALRILLDRDPVAML